MSITRVVLFAIGAVLSFAQTPVSSPRGASTVRVITPDEMTWTPVAGYPPRYARATLEGGADQSCPIRYRDTLG